MYGSNGTTRAKTCPAQKRLSSSAFPRPTGRVLQNPQTALLPNGSSQNSVRIVNNITKKDAETSTNSEHRRCRHVRLAELFHTQGTGEAQGAPPPWKTVGTSRYKARAVGSEILPESPNRHLPSATRCIAGNCRRRASIPGYGYSLAAMVALATGFYSPLVGCNDICWIELGSHI